LALDQLVLRRGVKPCVLHRNGGLVGEHHQHRAVVGRVVQPRQLRPDGQQPDQRVLQGDRHQEIGL
jgi:hypothetical protein